MSVNHIDGGTSFGATLGPCEVALHDQAVPVHLARHVGRQQPVTVLRGHRGDPDRIVDPKAGDSVEQQVIFHLFRQPPF